LMKSFYRNDFLCYGLELSCCNNSQCSIKSFLDIDKK